MKDVSPSPSRAEADPRMTDRAKWTVQQYPASIRRFEEALSSDPAEAEQEALRRKVDHLRHQPAGHCSAPALWRVSARWSLPTCSGTP